MSNVLTFKKTRVPTKKQEKREIDEFLAWLDALMIPYPEIDTLQELDDFVGQDWIMNAIKKRVKVIKAMMEAEYETKH